MKRIFIFLMLLVSIAVITSCDSDSSCEHNYKEVVYEATCVKNGYTERSCTKCEFSEIVNYVSPKEHTAEWRIVTPSTCSSNGTEIGVCSVCNQTVGSRTVEKLKHSYTSTKIAPTCTESGYDLHLCTLCGNSEKDNFTAPTSDHLENNGIITLQPTCDKIGKREYYCKVCNTFLREENIDVTEHDYMISYSKPSTGLEDGYTVYSCTICHNTYKGDYVPETIRANEIYEMLKDAMLEIIAKDKNGGEVSVGSGFFISEDGCIITNYHVIEAAYSLSVTKYDGTTLDVKLIGYDKEQDIAVLKAELKDQKYLEISNKIVKTGDPVYTLGSSLGLTDTFSTGIVSNVERNVNGKKCIQFTAPISPGNRGGPLVNEDGRVIGIVTLTAVDGQNINFAVKSSLIDSTSRFEPVEISDLYNEKLVENAYTILQNYIYVNRDGEDGEKYYILKTKEETPTTYGYNWYFVYDQNTNEIYTEMFIVADGMNVWSIKLLISSDFKYTVEFYDCSVNQLTLSATFEAKAGTDIETVSYNEERFNKAFSNVLNKYTDKIDTEVNEITQAKSIIFQSFLISMRFMNDTVNNSGTGVDMMLIGIVIE